MRVQDPKVSIEADNLTCYDCVGFEDGICSTRGREVDEDKKACYKFICSISGICKSGANRT